MTMTDGPLVPVVLKDDAFVPPGAETYYVVAGNGFFMERRTDLYTATVPVDGGVPGLRQHEAKLDLRLPQRLPRTLVESALGFFRAMYDRWEAEGVLVMFLAPPDGDRPARFRFDAPPQKIKGWVERGRFRADLRLDYGACERPGPAWRKLGTFHSHAHLAPHHSAVDARDELWETGLHLTAGYVNSSLPEFEASFVVNGARFPLAVDEVLVRPHGVRGFPKAWLERVTVIEESWVKSGARYDGYGYAY
jgi:hypothetical protein